MTEKPINEGNFDPQADAEETKKIVDGKDKAEKKEKEKKYKNVLDVEKIEKGVEQMEINERVKENKRISDELGDRKEEEDVGEHRS